MGKNVRMKDIADRVGVSVVTVSKALAGKNGVSDEVREQIRMEAENLGYRPASSRNSKVRILGTGNAGVLIPKKYLEKDSYYWELYQNVVAELGKRGYFSILGILDEESLSDPSIPRMVEEGKVDGLICLGQSTPEYADFIHEKSPVPVVFLDFYSAGQNVDCVVSDGFFGMYRLTELLIRKGHRRIGFVGSVLATSSITDRYFGYRKAMLEAGLEVRPEWVIEDRQKGIQQSKFIRLPSELPTAFACSSDTAAHMLAAQLEERGLSVPEDVSLVGFDNYDKRTPSGISLTTCDPNMERLASICVYTLLAKISGEEFFDGIQVVTGKICEGDSVREIGKTTG